MKKASDDDLQSLSLAASPLEDDDPDNGADFDVAVETEGVPDVDSTLPPTSSTSQAPSSSKKLSSVVEATSSAEGGVELDPLP